MNHLDDFLCEQQSDEFNEDYWFYESLYELAEQEYYDPEN